MANQLNRHRGNNYRVHQFQTEQHKPRNRGSLLFLFFILITLGLYSTLSIVYIHRLTLYSRPENAISEKTTHEDSSVASLKRKENDVSKSKGEGEKIESSSQKFSFKSRDRDHDKVLRSLQELTRSPPPGSIVCPSPHMTPIYDRILFSTSPRSENTTAVSLGGADRKIPRIVHFSFNNRCVPNDLATSIRLWSDALPDHSIFFHDDEAVKRLMEGDDRSNQSPLWHSSEHFPNLRDRMPCVTSTGAMLIDVWRMLVVWTYGGIYTDIDNWPGPKFNSQTIREEDSFFSLSDGKNRCSQWLFGMAPQHPIAIFTLQDLTRRLVLIKNVARPRVVRITGPMTLKTAFQKFKQLLKENATIFGESSYFTQIQKVDLATSDQYARGSLGGTFDEIVDHYYDEIHNTTYINITKRERAELISGIEHWTKQVNRTSKVSANKTEGESLNTVDKNLPLPPYAGVSCSDYLDALNK